MLYIIFREHNVTIKVGAKNVCKYIIGGGGAIAPCPIGSGVPALHESLVALCCSVSGEAVSFKKKWCVALRCFEQLLVKHRLQAKYVGK